MANHLYVVPAGRSLVLIPGNIDLLHRPSVKNPDGTTSSVYSYTFTLEDGIRAILLPGVIRNNAGRWITSKSKSQVLEAYRRTGQFLGVFRSETAAKKYAKLLHQEQAALMGGG